MEKCKCLGFEIDEEKNDKAIEDVVQDIGKEARHRTLVCQTDEQVRRLTLRNRQNTDPETVRNGQAMCCGSANKVTMPNQNSYMKKEICNIRAQCTGLKYHVHRGSKL